jgi:hypothetical protein
MVQVELKVKHFYLISYVLFKDQASVSFSTLEKIKIACANKLDDDLTTVESDVNFFITVFKKLGAEPEGQFTTPNEEMYNLLLPQITAGVTANDEDWITLATETQAIRTANQENVAAYIQYAKNKLNA